MRLLGRSSCLGFKTSLLLVPAVLFLILSHPFRLHLMNPEIPGFCLTSGSKFYHACQILGTPKSSQLPCLALSFPPRLPLALLVLSLNLWPIASRSFIALVEYSLTQQLRPCICHAVIFFFKENSCREIWNHDLHYYNQVRINLEALLEVFFMIKQGSAQKEYVGKQIPRL